MTDDNITFGPPVHFTVDGERIEAHAGQTIAAALIAAGRRTLRHTRVNGKARGVYCAMGVCYDCIVRVGERTERACMTRVEEGMEVTLPTQFPGAGA